MQSLHKVHKMNMQCGGHIHPSAYPFVCFISKTTQWIMIITFYIRRLYRKLLGEYNFCSYWCSI